VIYYIFTGSVVLRVNDNENDLITLTKGSCFGEESVLFDKPVAYDAIIQSDAAELFSIRK
jgi:CRP-like cAMP-binding protein